jgi:hypothetical protein
MEHEGQRGSYSGHSNGCHGGGGASESVMVAEGRKQEEIEMGEGVGFFIDGAWDPVNGYSSGGRGRWEIVVV